MQTAKEKAANAAASAKAGMEKTKATMQEKAERMTTRDPIQKDMATGKKDERIHEAERQKQEARAQNTATRQAASAGGTFGHDYTTGGDHNTATGQPTTGARQGLGGGWSEDTEVGLEDPNVAGGARTGYGAGNTF